MKGTPVDTAPKPVLGLFASETEFRDHLTHHLDLIETGLTYLKSEYRLENPTGTGGRIDILAEDSFGHAICIEVKRSNNSARATLNELSKYITLLVKQDRLPKEMIRCFVISTHWDELLLPLSYFASTTGIEVTALHATTFNGSLTLNTKPLIPVSFLPQLSPDMDFIWFENEDAQTQYIEFIKTRSLQLPFVRLALLLFELTPSHTSEREPFFMVICVWRLGLEHHDIVESKIGQQIGADFPYAANGWEAESDAKDWISSVPHDEIPEVAQGWQHGNSEKLQKLMSDYLITKVERIGQWPKQEIINNDEKILKSVLSHSPLGGSGRPNRHSFQAEATPKVKTSWKMGVDGFLRFIAFEPVWHDAAKGFLETLTGDFKVEFRALDKKHLIYSIHQARFHKETSLSFFEIIVSIDGNVTRALIGQYFWNGQDCPADASAAIEQIYGSTGWARMSIQSAVDNRRYEQALSLHGFEPKVQLVDKTVVSDKLSVGHSVSDFVRANNDYSREITETLEQHGHLPSDPSA